MRKEALRTLEPPRLAPSIDRMQHGGEAHCTRTHYTRREEIVHAVTHGAGLLLSAGGLAVLVAVAGLRGSSLHVAGCGIFGAGLVALYAASTFYHGVRAPHLKRILQRFDHSAIFLLIAATYTPFLLLELGGGWSWTLLGLVWALAIVGIVLQVGFPHARRWSVPLYLGMGWMVITVAEPLGHALGRAGLTLLVSGGLAYSAGLVFYAWERLPYNHAVWHLFVLAGSSLHFACVLGFVIPRGA